MADLVIAALVAGPLEAGQPGFLAVEYTIQPGWHIYWENPGESGIPTEVSLELPDGVTAQPTQYPGPHSFPAPGDLINYGYENHTTLLVPVTLSGDPQGTASASTRWLVCRDEQCVPGKADLTLDLAAPPTLDVSAASAHLPAPMPDNATVTRSAGDITVSIPGATIEETYANLALETVFVQAASRGEQARLWLSDAAPAGSSVVFRVQQDGAERFYALAP